MLPGKESYREIVVYGDDFWDFYYGQNVRVREKILWTLRLVGDMPIVPKEYFTHLEGTDLYEVRVIFGGNIFRIFCFFDRGRLVVLLNAFQKKSQKTPRKEIEKALKLKEKYYETKEQNS